MLLSLLGESDENPIGARAGQSPMEKVGSLFAFSKLLSAARKVSVHPLLMWLAYMMLMKPLNASSLSTRELAVSRDTGTDCLAAPA